MKVEKFKNINIAYMRNMGEYSANNKGLMEIFKGYLKDNNLLKDNSVILGIALDNPQLVSSDKLRYDVGIIIKGNEKCSLDTRKIDDGKYAIFEVPHTVEGIQSFWVNISSKTSGLSVDYEKPIIERYAMDKINQHLCEFCIPLLD